MDNNVDRLSIFYIQGETDYYHDESKLDTKT
jgi:hypothetical protein